MNPDGRKTQVQRIRVRFLGRVIEDSFLIQNETPRSAPARSKEAWKLWLEHSKMVMNEYRLNPLDPNSQKIMEEQMEQFFFGEGSKLPEGYVPPKAKG